jgi:hypothetical protein
MWASTAPWFCTLSAIQLADVALSCLVVLPGAFALLASRFWKVIASFSFLT